MRKLFAAALLVLAACSDSTGPNARLGTYSLVSINGQDLPVVVGTISGTTVEIISGEVTLNSNGTFTDRTDYRFTSNAGVDTDFEIATGTYSVNGNNVTFLTSDGDSYSMAISGQTLTQVEPGLTLIYER